MSLLTYTRYVSLTGDSTSASEDVEGWITDAEQAVSEFLRRPLELGEYTDTLTIDTDGRVYPKAVPLVSLPATATDAGQSILDSRSVGYLGGWDLTIEHTIDLINQTGYLVQQPQIAVTYTGGWTADTAPFSVLRTIARAAYAVGHPVPLDSPLVGGATSLHVGDVSVTLKNPTGSGLGVSELESLAPGSELALSGWQWSEDYA